MKEQLELFRLTSALSDLISIYFSKVANEEVKKMKEFFDVEKVMLSRTITQKSLSYHKRHQLKSFKRRKILMPIEEDSVQDVRIDIGNVQMDPDGETFCVIL